MAPVSRRRHAKALVQSLLLLVISSSICHCSRGRRHGCGRWLSSWWLSFLLRALILNLQLLRRLHYSAPQSTTPEVSTLSDFEA